MISICYQGKTFNITVGQVYAPTTNVKEAEAELFCDDLKDYLELTHTHTHTKMLFSSLGWNAEVGSQEISRVTGKFSLVV